jgi:DNA (cytosine-5)-methyltransferase 1
MEKIRVFTAFSGYDSQCLSLDRLKKKYPEFDYELVGWSEIDKYAIQAHNAIYPQWADRNYGDISKINWDEVPDFDLFTYSSPCQDFSNAGLQRGGEEGSGTRSSLLWECRRAIVAKKPKFLLMENVAALVSQKFIKTFNKWQEELARYGYTNFAQVLNAKDYGIPQNRERIFLVSVLGEAWYNFPQPFKLEKRLKDVLETNVDEKYYLSEKMIAGFEKHNANHEAKGTGFKFQPKTKDDIAVCIRANSALCPTDNAVIDEQCDTSFFNTQEE